MTVKNSEVKVASRSSWEILPMPARKSRLLICRSFTQNEFQQLAKGLIPESMDDKWFVFLENDWLYFHRSWTGACIYQIRIADKKEKYEITETWVNRNFRQYKNISKVFDKFLLNFLINGLLKSKRV
jgi:hypothetical protein